MRLLHVRTLEFQEFHRDVPKYVIASHRWSSGNEAMTSDMEGKRNASKSGYKKVVGFANYIREHIGHVDWLWIDTCCINQDSSQEVNEAVNSMFRWYSNAEICLAYLTDVHKPEDESEFRQSAWFRRGWTLQELLAPKVVIFLSLHWQLIGCKGDFSYLTGETGPVKGPRLERIVAQITSIPENILHDFGQRQRLTTEEKLAWIVGRDTTRPEDMYYSLFGIFNVAMTVLYGEGMVSARRRLLMKIDKKQGFDKFREIERWLAPPDPWVNHRAARQLHEPRTGSWLLESKHYANWTSGVSKHSWLHGKPGSGKTMLCSTIIESLQRHCEWSENSGFGIFYFTFSDARKQSFESLLLSLVAQLGWKEPAQSMLRKIYNTPGQSTPAASALEDILISSVRQYEEVFILLDAVDECPEENDLRQGVLQGILRLARIAPNLKFFTTSRELLDVKESMDDLSAIPISTNTPGLDADIKTYVQSILAHDRKLKRWPQPMKDKVLKTLVQNADGMFRWAFCQLNELKKLRSTRPMRIEEALQSLPRTLDDTYERILTRIESDDRQDALTMLRWLAFERQPLTLQEIAEVRIIDPSGHGTVEFDNRGQMEDVLEILAGLITIDRGGGHDVVEKASTKIHDFEDIDLVIGGFKHVSGDIRVRLAHFSVREYLVSDRILDGTAKEYHLREGREHRFIAQSCLAYLLHYSTNNLKGSSEQDLEKFPLLEYAAKSWFYHSSLQQPNEVGHEIQLLTQDEPKEDWLCLYSPDWFDIRFRRDRCDSGTGLYYACLLGLKPVVRELLAIEASADYDDENFGNSLNTHGGLFGHPLQAASLMGYGSIVEILLDRGADVNVQGGFFGNALQAASLVGHKRIVDRLLAEGADVNATGAYFGNVQGGYFGHALQAAAFEGHESIVKLLLDHGADVNAIGGCFGNALQAAIFEGHRGITEMLLDRNADINTQSGRFGSALEAALFRGHEDIVEMLLERGGARYGPAL